MKNYVLFTEKGIIKNEICKCGHNKTEHIKTIDRRTIDNKSKFLLCCNVKYDKNNNPYSICSCNKYEGEIKNETKTRRKTRRKNTTKNSISLL